MKGYQKPSGVPWRLWAVLITIGLGLLFGDWLFPPALERSSPRLEFHGDIPTAVFDVTSHAHTTISRILSVSAGLASRRREDGQSYRPLGQREITVTLDPSDTKHLACEFPDLAHLQPNAVEVTVRP